MNQAVQPGQPEEIVLPPDADEDAPIQLSKNFWLREFHHPRADIPEELVPALEGFVQKNVQKIRDFFNTPMSILSGYRPPKYNQRPGQAKYSYHQYGHVTRKGEPVQEEASVKNRPGKFAVDIQVRGVQPIFVYQAILGLMRLGVIEKGAVIAYKNFVHYDNRGVIVPL